MNRHGAAYAAGDEDSVREEYPAGARQSCTSQDSPAQGKATPQNITIFPGKAPDKTDLIMKRYCEYRLPMYPGESHRFAGLFCLPAAW